MKIHTEKQFVAVAQGGYTGTEAKTITKRIGSTTYEVSVHFNKTSTETLEDKILRLVRSDAASGKAA